MLSQDSLFANKTILILAGIMVINALGYGIIIPLLYPYAAQFGITPFGLSLLFVSFSVFQFLATPILGQLSDMYGRKPVLAVSILGTSLSLVLFALANSVPLLFISRIIDGITGGNISVAQAVIADSTTGPKRAQAFGILGAAFGFGFMIGPALGGFLSQISLTAPFWFSALIALVGALAVMLFLPETLDKSQQVKSEREPIFNLPELFRALFLPFVGTILLLTFLTTVAQHSFYIAFQTFSVDVLRLSPTQIGVTFASLGFINILMQAGGVKWIIEKFGSRRRVLGVGIVVGAVAMAAVSLVRSFALFAVSSMVYMVSQAPVFVILPSILSEKTPAHEQGKTMGVNQSYMALGQIAGPLLAGLVGQVSVPGMFLVSGILLLLALVPKRRLADVKRN